MKGIFKYSLLASLVIAGTAQSDEFRQHEAHVHGHVAFNIAQDGNELLFEITAPGADVVGFEHPPENQAQHQIIEAAEKKLQNASDIIVLASSAGCEVEHVEVANTLEGEHHDEHEEHEHEADEHDAHEHEQHQADEHDDHEHEEHEHEADEHDDHEHEEHQGHGEFRVEYHFECTNIAALNEIDTSWFKHFPSTEEVEVNLLTDSAQIAAELNKENTVIKFK